MLSVERVEVLRGPATLLYGNTAVGGVVNTIDERVPDHVPQSPIASSLYSGQYQRTPTKRSRNS